MSSKKKKTQWEPSTGGTVPREWARASNSKKKGRGKNKVPAVPIERVQMHLLSLVSSKENELLKEYTKGDAHWAERVYKEKNVEYRKFRKWMEAKHPHAYFFILGIGTILFNEEAFKDGYV